MENKHSLKPIHILPNEVARKIAAGEVIDRPNAIVRELMDNAVDSGAHSILVEIDGGGIDKIRIVDDGNGMTKEDLSNCARPHATSKISSETDLLNLSTLGFRGEALASIAAVSHLEIISRRQEESWKLTASATEDHVIEPSVSPKGTIVSSSSLFENFPARRVFLKRPAAESNLCRLTFIEKALPRPDIAFKLIIDGRQRLDLNAGTTLSERFASACGFSEQSSLFYELNAGADKKPEWSYSLIIGESSVSRTDKRDIYIYVNGRKITEYSLVQAIEYGAQGYFPNGTHPVACLFLQMDPSTVDFNIHPAKKEARFKDISTIHHSISSTIRAFFHDNTISNLLHNINTDKEEHFSEGALSFTNNISNDTSYKKVPIDTLEKEFSKNDLYPVHEKEPDYTGYSGPYTSSLPKERNIQLAEQALHINNYDNSLTESDISTSSLHNTNKKDDIHYIGMALGVFLLAEKDNTLYAIDQHAAHERILFNKIMENSGKQQQLLVPYVIETLSEDDDIYLESISNELKKAGFNIKDCNNGRWEIYSVPDFWDGTEKDLSADILEKKIKPNEILRTLAATAACKAAIKDGDYLDDETAIQLVKKAFMLPEKRCPHGRPIMTCFTKSDLFTLVHRT